MSKKLLRITQTGRLLLTHEFVEGSSISLLPDGTLRVPEIHENPQAGTDTLWSSLTTKTWNELSAYTWNELQLLQNGLPKQGISIRANVVFVNEVVEGCSF